MALRTEREKLSRRNLVLEKRCDFKMLTFRCKKKKKMWDRKMGRRRTRDLAFRVDGAGKFHLLSKF